LNGFGGEFLVKIITSTGEERKFDSKNVESDLEAAGVPERVAEEVAERVEDRVEDNMTTAKVNEQIDIELKRLEEDIDRAHKSWLEKLRLATGESTRENRTDAERTDTFIPESQRERHDRYERNMY
jgi:hypothetical protein